MTAAPPLTLPHPPVRTGGPAPGAPPGARPDRPSRPAPSVVAIRQGLLARGAVRALAAAGTNAVLGRYGIHAAVEVTAGTGGRLVLVPMGDLPDLDPALDPPSADPAVWHVMARGAAGTFVDGPGRSGPRACPSVLWAVRAGLAPSAAVGLVDAALADPALAALLLRARR